ncbi:TM0106 family RecB-like putative nuclease [Arsenicicoccus dermatophilus]|uniref:TM0106 family RecB-like putative nuclease n=1 Tax=Arsenicicoccus dermatophilus TaxID=1076331 RepID=UPI001F4C5BA2|nr:bifunctional RecB family nuclease/DEAD/DEAH box helicase [Arsenicicoccus dermatophilus]MCH8611697.1 TM0106 family RecB-like putative nuclease [Arsenicicoccus dermatophilus]
MHRIDDRFVISASDLTRASACELALLRDLDVRLGRLPAPEAVPDPMMAQLAQLGDAHEQLELERWLRVHGEAGVREIPRPRPTHEELVQAREATFAAMREGVPVVYQGCFYDGELMGFADFLVRADGWQPDRPAYEVHDTKLARHAKVTALLQLAAYADQLRRGGVDPTDRVTLVLGDRSRPTYPVAELLAVYAERRRHLLGLVADRVAAVAPLAWGEPGVSACGSCDVCSTEVAAHRDVLLVAGVRATQRKRLLAAGVRTIDDLARHEGPVEGLGRATLDKLQAQARLQVLQSPPDGSAGQISVEVHTPEAISAIPAPDEGDIFFDFEGDPLWAGDETDAQGLEYLFGVVETDGTFRPFWAHDRAQEKAALLDFLAYVEERRAHHPGLHIYHYAPYERTALLKLAGRHGAGEEAVDRLLREGILVDLYQVVKRSIRVSQPSYSIKKLEPLYMGDQLRGGDVTTAGDSIVEYHRWCEARARGDRAEADRLLQAIADYNEYDCVSTLRLRDWLLELMRDAGVAAREPRRLEELPEDEEDALVDPRAEVAEALAALAGPAEDRCDDDHAIALVGAAVGYHQRESKPFWWAHFDRLQSALDDWPVSRDAFVVDRVEVVEDWGKPPGRRSLRRVLSAVGRHEPGMPFTEGASGYLLYPPPVPDGLQQPSPEAMGTTSSLTVTEAEPVAGGRVRLTLEERLAKGCEAYVDLPVALTVGPPPPVKAVQEALLDLAQQVRREGLPEHPGIEILRRRPPRLSGLDALPPVVDGDAVAAITAAVQALDHSYLAVQGPPGTGKTYVASRVIAALVRLGWRIGVVAQSHAVVENVLDRVVAVGVDARQVGKTKTRQEDAPWTPLKDTRALRTFLDEHRDAAAGCVIGGTMWDYCNLNAVDEGELDLLVVDEAGQYSLANTLAVARATRRLLLLGDPRQLPQVSQGIHPEPIDESALGWLSAGHDTLPPELGYFLERTWRMHPAVCEPVSHLSYAGRLRSQEVATLGRSLEGVDPGLQVVTVDHHDNAVSSVEEADEVVRVVQSLLGRSWRPAADAPATPLAEDGFVVVAPYNAQVGTIRAALDRAGLRDVRVGTVDLFQGQEAPVAIMSMTASALADLPRGADFLLNRNRLNVAISRAQWLAVVVRSANLTSLTPTTPEQLLQLGGFIRLCESRSRPRV